MVRKVILVALLPSLVFGADLSSSQSQSITSVAAQTTAITSCHFHGVTQFCINGEGKEGYISPNPTATTSAPTRYTACHSHETDVFCMAGSSEFQFIVEEDEHSDDAHSHEALSQETHSQETDSQSQSITSVAAQTTAITSCHFHGVTQFCINGEGKEGYISPNPTATTSAPTRSSEFQFIVEEEEHSDDAHSHEAHSHEAHSHEAHSQETDSQSQSITSVAAQTTAITSCHFHGVTQFCINGEGKEGYISPNPTATTSAPTSYTACHSHETDVFCMAGSSEFQFIVAGEKAAESGALGESSSGGLNCHFHAGVEHCVGSEGEGSAENTCERVDRDYNIPLRIGTLFGVLAASAIGVFLPMFVSNYNNAFFELAVSFLTQFGTGVIISTALVHLVTHSQLMFSNECLELKYEGTATAIVIAGLFIGFLVDFICHRVLLERLNVVENDASNSEDDEKRPVQTQSVELETSDKMSVILLEAGIIFHSVLIGVTTVVAGDSYYITLFIVVLFHQAFEGVALGSRIASLTKSNIWFKILMGLAFAITTPIGMAIVIAIGTLDAFSAGVLLWVGLIEMLAHDWLHGPLANAGLVRISLSLVALVAGLVLMSFLGKWA
ncbi:CIC11C00000000948 [Sungouiella intermedia]|uniref:CIC11C00000000948 n=1 Tax=Sungouiella intermedia TaxID=45354 RepID=A0A1L0C514_9ASCO|nr:CIC11C00000000948 [[Candida] intermedia]